jgi:hypothetical protein
VGNSAERRERAWELAHSVYCARGYEAAGSGRLRILLQDALPETTTFLAEARPRATTALATLTLVPDSPLGLPMDGDCAGELAALRARGRRLCEVAKLAVAEGHEAVGGLGRGILLHLFRLAYLKASRLEKATDMVVSVVPRHARFYEKVLLFRPLGEARSYGSVCGTTGVPLRLDLTSAPKAYFAKYGARRGDRNLYRFFLNEQEDELLKWMRGGQRAMSEAELRDFLVERTDLLERATPEERMYLQGRYLAHDFDRIFVEAEIGSGRTSVIRRRLRW